MPEEITEQQLAEAKEAILTAKITLVRYHPFYAVPVMHCRFIQAVVQAAQEAVTTSTFIPDGSVDRIGINRYGEIRYNPAWVLTLARDTLPGLLCHEVMHVMLMHFIFHPPKHQLVWNIAEDIKINHLILMGSQFKLPPDGYMPTNNACEIPMIQYTVNNIQEKSCEQIFDEILPKFLEKGIDTSGSDRSGEGDMCIDSHDRTSRAGEGAGKDAQSQEAALAKEAAELSDKWKQVMANAVTLARQQGKMPAGMEKLVEDILEPKLNWRDMLYKYVTEKIPFDYTWGRRNNKSLAHGIYLPATKGEHLDMIGHLDSSGSILNDAPVLLAELKGILSGFDNVSMTMIVCDAKVQGVYDLKSTDVDDIMAAMDGSIKGGGGTSHEPVVRWIEENMPDARVFVTLTDGYSDMERCLPRLDMPIITALAGAYKTPNTFHELGEVLIVE